MPCEPKLSVGTFFEEVDDTGVLHHYWILSVAKSLRPSSDHFRQPVELKGDLATTAASADSTKRITWDITGVITAGSMPAIG